jgi:hypothetical protein
VHTTPFWNNLNHQFIVFGSKQTKEPIQEIWNRLCLIWYLQRWWVFSPFFKYWDYLRIIQFRILIGPNLINTTFYDNVCKLFALNQWSSSTFFINQSWTKLYILHANECGVTQTAKIKTPIVFRWNVCVNVSLSIHVFLTKISYVCVCLTMHIQINKKKYSFLRK